MNAADFSTNRHSSNVHMTIHMASKHTDLYFNDGNIILLAGMSYFLVHQGLLARHSEVLDELMRSMDDTPTLEDHAVLPLPDSSTDVAHFLKAMYDGMLEHVSFSLHSS
jgi:hypothetical protein